MKILGRAKLNPRTIDVILGVDEEGEPLRLRLRALSVTEMEQIGERLGPGPVAPLISGQVEKNPDGSPKRDAAGRPIPRRNEQDATYQEARGNYNLAFMFAFLLSSAGDQIEPGVDRAGFDDEVAWLCAVEEEFRLAMPDAATYKRVIRALTALMSDDEFAFGEEALGVKRTKPVMRVDASGN